MKLLYRILRRPDIAAGALIAVLFLFALSIPLWAR